MSKNYEKVKKHYDDGFWDEERVRVMVAKSVITAEEFQIITGKVYESGD